MSRRPKIKLLGPLEPIVHDVLEEFNLVSPPPLDKSKREMLKRAGLVAAGAIAGEVLEGDDSAQVARAKADVAKAKADLAEARADEKETEERLRELQERVRKASAALKKVLPKNPPVSHRE